MRPRSTLTPALSPVGERGQLPEDPHVGSFTGRRLLMSALWLATNVYSLLVGWGQDAAAFFASPPRAALVAVWCVGGLLTVLFTGGAPRQTPATTPASKRKHGRRGLVRVAAVADSNGSPAFASHRLKIAAFGFFWAFFLVGLARMDQKGFFVLPERLELIRYIGLLLFTVGGLLRLLAIRTREIAQTKRRLAASGVYRHIRHPEYLGILLLLFGLSLVFRSGICLLVGLFWTGVIVVRIAREEARLVEGVPGYDRYQAKTDRLIYRVY